MSRREKTPKKLECKAKVRELMQEPYANGISNINTMFNELSDTFRKMIWKASWRINWDNSKYDYRNKDTGNSRNGHQVKIGVCGRRQSTENAVFGDDGHHQKMDWQASGMGCNSRLTGDIFHRSPAGFRVDSQIIL